MSATLFFPNERDATLEVEVKRDGTIISATAYYPDFDCWLDCKKELEQSKKWSEWVRQELADYDWSDWSSDEGCLETIKEMLKPA